MKPKKVALIIADWPIYERFCPNFVGMQDGLKTLGIEHQLFSCRPTLDVQKVIDYQPDLVVYGLLDMVKNKLWRNKIREALPKAKIVMWYGDLRNEHTGQVEQDMSEIDMMFVSNSAQSDYYKNLWKVPHCEFLPLGATVVEPVVDERFKFPFVFVGAKITGSWFAERAKMIIDLEGYGLKVVNASASQFPELRAKILKQIPVMYRSSDITLDISHFTKIDSYTSNRYWVITASGGFALTKRFPRCENFYPEGTRVYFDTLEECVEKMVYYTEHPDEREIIRKAGHDHAKNHSYDKRFLEMFNKIYENK